MASFQKFDTITVTPSAAVATDATVTFTYPTTSPARAAASYKAASGAVLAARGLQTVINQGADTFTLAYGAYSVVLTYKDATSLPAGKQLTLQIPLADYEDLTLLTDSSGGTASDTLAAITGSYVEATIENTVASLAAKVNALVAAQNKINALLRSRDIMPE